MSQVTSRCLQDRLEIADRLTSLLSNAALDELACCWVPATLSSPKNELSGSSGLRIRPHGFRKCRTGYDLDDHASSFLGHQVKTAQMVWRAGRRTLAFSCGARSASELDEKLT